MKLKARSTSVKRETATEESKFIWCLLNEPNFYPSMASFILTNQKFRFKVLVTIVREDTERERINLLSGDSIL